MLHAVVMAGGSGTRFWPLSRTALPKQLLALVTERTLIEETVARLEGLVAPARTWIVTNAAYADPVRRMLPALPPRNVVAEPCGRDTAPCIGFAATLALREDPDAVLAVLAADHVVDPPVGLRRTLARAAGLVGQEPGRIVLFGVRPLRPATGYGYIERGAEGGRADGVPWYRVAAFREKPDLATARRFVDAGTFLWNSGIFVFRADAVLERIAEHLPELAAGLPAVAGEWLEHGRVETASYQRLPRISIDFGVLERERERLAVLETEFAWDDVGSFAALERVLPGDEAGNRILGPATAVGARDNVVVSRPGHRVALLGVSDLVVVHTPDATLVCRKTDAEDVKKMVERLREQGLTDLL